MRRHFFLSDTFKLWMLCAFCLILGAAGCGLAPSSASTKEGSTPPGGGAGKGKSKGAGGPAPVTVAKVAQRDVPLDVRAIGNVESNSVVSVRPQVTGELRTIHFKEGDFVKAGELLFTVDSRIYEAQLRQIEANLQRDAATLAQAEANLQRDIATEQRAIVQAKRYDELAKQGVMSKDQNEQFQATAKSAGESVKADQAAIENAKAQAAANRAMLDGQKVLVSYTKIYAPITGRTGAILVKPGNIVQPGTTELTVINQLQPVFVSFGVPEQFLASIRRRVSENLPVKAEPEDGSGKPQIGRLAFVDNAVDSTTGTIRLKATFSNDDRALWPGQFVRVVMQLDHRANALVVPNQAVQSSQDGQFVYVVKDDQTVEMRTVVVGPRVDQDVVIDKGLGGGETVVTDGQLRIVPGGKVLVRDPSGTRKKKKES